MKPRMPGEGPGALSWEPANGFEQGCGMIGQGKLAPSGTLNSDIHVGIINSSVTISIPATAIQTPWGESQISFLPLPDHSPCVTGADFLKHMDPLPRHLKSLLTPSCRGPESLIPAFQALPGVFPLSMPSLTS